MMLRGKVFLKLSENLVHYKQKLSRKRITTLYVQESFYRVASLGFGHFWTALLNSD